MNDEERQQLNDIHEFLFETPIGKDENRATRLARFLDNLDAGYFGVRVVAWIAGLLTAIGGAWAVVKGWWTF